MFVVQSQLRPAAIQSALYDLIRDGLTRVRICSAYMTVMGSRTLLDAIVRSVSNGTHADVPKTIVTSLDFGLTEPAALRMWRDQPAADIRVAGAAALERSTLTPTAAFHPKLYMFDRPDGVVATLVTSANLTNRGLTVNTEVGYKVMAADSAATDAWRAATDLAVPLTDDILRLYEAQRRPTAERVADEVERVPAPNVPARGLPHFEPALVELGKHDQLWVQSWGMSGGSATQLELPRGAHRFFGVADVDYGVTQVNEIAEPTLVSGPRSWEGNPLRWHGNNRMERINLPSAARGGYDYANSLVLFRVLDANVYELRVYGWDTDTARSYVEASRQAGLLFRVGQGTSRLAGLIS